MFLVGFLGFSSPDQCHHLPIELTEFFWLLHMGLAPTAHIVDVAGSSILVLHQLLK